VSSNGQVVNRLPPGRYFVHQVPAGVYDYSVKAETTDVLKVNVEEGQTSYVRCAINMGIMTGRPNLSTQTREDSTSAARSSSYKPPGSRRTTRTRRPKRPRRPQPSTKRVASSPA
jgi:hypothetical protein